jgi:hypothetical protein
MGSMYGSRDCRDWAFAWLCGAVLWVFSRETRLAAVYGTFPACDDYGRPKIAC